MIACVVPTAAEVQRAEVRRAARSSTQRGVATVTGGVVGPHTGVRSQLRGTTALVVECLGFGD